MQKSRQPTFQDSPYPRALPSLKSPHSRALPSLKSTHPRALCGLESPHPGELPGLKCWCFFIFSFYLRPTQWVPQNTKSSSTFVRVPPLTQQCVTSMKPLNGFNWVSSRVELFNGNKQINLSSTYSHLVFHFL
jgi:hypothetical protein